MRFPKRLLAGLALFALLAGQGCTRAPSQETVRASQPVTLNVWGVVDQFEVYQPAFEAFRQMHPNVSFNYRTFRLEEYEREILNALAEDRGPDIFMIHNTWTNKYLSKITPMPPQTDIAYRVQQGRNIVWELRTEPSISVREFKAQFADAALNDILRTVNIAPAGSDTRNLQERPMGMPVGVDTMALYYNKDLLNVAGVATPPATWTEFVEAVKKVTKIDAQGELVQPGAGIGTAENVERSTDLLTALMVQNGTEMADASGQPTFQTIPAALRNTRETPPSWPALEFYVGFADPTKETFTWTASQPNSLDAFIQNRTAFFFGYAYHYDQIRSRAPRLNLGIAPLPQVDPAFPKNIANYWYFAVAQKSTHQDAAWNFLNRLVEPETLTAVLARANRPSARKSLLAAQLESERVGVFASQVLTAVSWYKGRDPERMEQALKALITNVGTGVMPIQNAMRLAAETISQTIGQ